MHIINTIDGTIYNLIANLINSNTTAIMMFISHLGSAVTLITLTIAFIVILKNKRDAKYIAINLTTVFILNRILKLIIARPRPEILRLVAEDGYSFPSGHAMVSIGYYGYIIYLIYKYVKNKKARNIIISLLALLILLIGISRIYLGVHYVTDIIGAYIIGLVYLYIFIKKTE